MTDSKCPITITPTRAGSLIIEAPYCTQSEATNAGHGKLGEGCERVIIAAEDIADFALKFINAWATAKKGAA